MLGSGTTFPDADRGPAGFAVIAGGTRLLVDGGGGTSQRLMRAGIDPRDLDGGLYSHWHPDHLGELVPLLFTFRVTGRTLPYPLWGGQGFQHVLDGLDAVFGHWLHVARAPVRCHELSLTDPSRFAIGAIQIEARPANHGAGALHYAFEHGGTRVVYSGDTGPSAALVELARGCDLLVCECAGSDERPLEGHLHPSAIAELVAEAQPREVWLTHLYPDVDPELALQTLRATGVPVRRADDLDVFTR